MFQVSLRLAVTWPSLIPQLPWRKYISTNNRPDNLVIKTECQVGPRISEQYIGMQIEYLVTVMCCYFFQALDSSTYVIQKERPQYFKIVMHHKRV